MHVFFQHVLVANVLLVGLLEGSSRMNELAPQPVGTVEVLVVLLAQLGLVF